MDLRYNVYQLGEFMAKKISIWDACNVYQLGEFTEKKIWIRDTMCINWPILAKVVPGWVKLEGIC